MAPGGELSLSLDTNDRPREYGNHHIGVVYATDNARVFLGNAERAEFGDNNDDSQRVTDDENLLLKALHYEVMNTRRNQILSAAKNTCEWIWTSDFRKFLSNPTTKVFWIAGKPGSGKSTLMKYLASSLLELKQILPSTWKYAHNHEVVDICWTTVNFFFDFRLATKLGNTLEGLLRTLLYQFVKALPELAGKFAPDTTQFKDFSLDQLRAALDKVLISLNGSMTHVLILVDGLDEFTGRKKGILDSLLLLSGHENVKLCLASRPESMIREKLAHVQSLSVSNHNNPGIRQFIRDAISDFLSRSDALQLRDIESLILTRALGVFLWVYYAVEATLQAYAQGDTVEEIELILTELPEEIEAIYDRILQDIPVYRRPEAATLYMLINRADFDVSLELLRSTFYLLNRYLGIGLVDIEDSDHFSRRLHGTMGGLVDIITGVGNKDLRQPKHVRLMHETLKSHVSKSQWVESYLPDGLSKYAADDPWFYVGSQALFAVALDESALIADQLTKVCLADAKPDLDRKHKVKDSESGMDISPTNSGLVFESIATGLRMTQSHTNHKLERLVHVLCYGIIFIPPVCARRLKSLEISNELRSICEKLLTLRLVAWHFVLARSLEAYTGLSAKLYDIAGSSRLPMDHEIQDLLLASAYNIHGYLNENMYRISLLKDQQRDEIVGTIIASSFRWPQRGSREYIKDKSLDTSKVPLLVDKILTHTDKYSNFHLAVYLVLGYECAPHYIQRLQQRVGKRISYDWSCLDLPKWVNSFDATSSGMLRTWFPVGSPLSIWRAESRLRVQGRLADGQLTVLNSLRINSINPEMGRSSEPTSTAPHYTLETLLNPAFIESLADDHPHASSLANAVAKRIYQLEQRGAPFPDMPASLIDPDDALSSGSMLFTTLRMLQGLLVHRENEGHLPQPLPSEDEFDAQQFCNECCRAYSTRCDAVSYEIPSVRIDHFAQLLYGIGSCYSENTTRLIPHRQGNIRLTSADSHENVVRVAQEILLAIMRQKVGQDLDLVQGLVQGLFIHVPENGPWTHLNRSMPESSKENTWSRLTNFRKLSPPELDDSLLSSGTFSRPGFSSEPIFFSDEIVLRSSTQNRNPQSV